MINIAELYCNQHTATLEWQDWAAACNEDGHEFGVFITLRASAHNCIHIQRLESKRKARDIEGFTAAELLAVFIHEKSAKVVTAG